MESSLEDDIAHGCCFDAWSLNPRKAYCTPTKTAGSWFIDEPSQLRKKTSTISNRKVENFKGLWSHVNPRPTAILSLLSLFYCRIFKTFGTPILKENKIAIWAQQVNRTFKASGVIVYFCQYHCNVLVLGATWHSPQLQLWKIPFFCQIFCPP